MEFRIIYDHELPGCRTNTIAQAIPSVSQFPVQMTKTTIVDNENLTNPSVSVSNPKNSSASNISSPQLFALQARQKGEWKDLIYREALRMTGALRQLLTSGNNNRSQLVFSQMLFKYKFNCKFFHLGQKILEQVQRAS